MDLCPTPSERVARARADLRMGLPVVVRDGARDTVLASAETLSADRLSALRTLGPVVMGLTSWRAQTLKARAYDGDIARVSVPAEADLRWLRAMADPRDDLAVPMKGPFAPVRDNAAAPWRAGVALAKSAHLLPAVVGVVASAPEGLTVLNLIELTDILAQEAVMSRVVAARVPVAPGPGRLHVYRPDDGGEEHYAFEVAAPDRSAPVLVRLHSACFTGDVLGSLKCDCGPQLHAALAQMSAGGVLLYLNQEGRGIGLANKMRAYALQDQGFDTVDANHRLGFEDDERDFRLGAALLHNLGITRVRLLTNNPAKVAMLEAHGIAVTERVALRVGETPQNSAYLATKAAKSGHIL